MKILFKKLADFAPFIAIIILALLPVYYTWGRLPIWGDTIIPFSSSGLEKYLFQWISLQNGQYFSLNYLPYFFFYKLIELFTHNVYYISAVLLFLLKIIAGLGIYKLSRLIYNEKRKVLYSLPVIFYLLSPAQLNASYYLYIYSFAPWFLYFIFKIIKFRKILIQDIIWLSIILFFSSINLPNPKYIFHLFLISIIIFIASSLFKLANVNLFLKNWWKLLIFLFLSAYLIIPLFIFVTFYSAGKYDVHIKAGYQDEGQMIDFGESTLDRMFKLHKDTLNLNKNAIIRYNSNAIINLLSYLFVILIIYSAIFLKNKNKDLRKYQYVLLTLSVVYLFLAAGPNPPLGFLYQHTVESFSLLAFLRTTAGATFFLSVFFALLLFPLVLNQKTIKRQNIILILLIIAFCVVGYPLLNGESYKNVKVGSPNTNTAERGIKIPDDYFNIQDLLRSIKIDAKVLYTNAEYSYIATAWGYFGVPIYDFIYNTNNVDCKNITDPLLYNIGFIFTDKSSLDRQNCPLSTNKDDIIKQTNFIEFSKISKDLFLPLFTASKKIIFDEQNSSGSDISEKTKEVESSGDKSPVLEFKKINPTKYRIRVHGAEGVFPLVFSENFHDAWKAYLTQSSSPQLTVPNPFQNLNDQLSNYKILDGNSEDQASKDELTEYIKNGWVTTLGDLKEKEISHKKWENNDEKTDYVEKYKIDFVSKNFQGTVQNDNLPEGKLWETWLAGKAGENTSNGLFSFLTRDKPALQVPDEDHLMVNGYANSWVIDSAKVCSGNSKCLKNPDGSFDMEFVVEFWPQKMYYLGVLVSGITLLGCIIFLICHWQINKRRKNAGRNVEKIK